MFTAFYSGLISLLNDPVYYSLDYSYFIDVYKTVIVDSLSLKEIPVDTTNPLIQSIDEFLTGHLINLPDTVRYFLFLKEKTDEIKKEKGADFSEVLVCTKGYVTLFVFPFLMNNSRDEEYLIREFLKITDSTEINSLCVDLIKETLAYHYYAFPFKPVYYTPFTGFAFPSLPFTLSMMNNIFQKFRNMKDVGSNSREAENTDIFECSIHRDFTFFTLVSAVPFPAETREEIEVIVQWVEQRTFSLRDKITSLMVPLQ